MLRKKGCMYEKKDYELLLNFFTANWNVWLTIDSVRNPFYLRSSHTWYFLSGTMEHEKWFYTGFCGSQARVTRNNCGSVLTTLP